MAGNRRFLDPDDAGEGLRNFFKEWREYRGMTQGQVEAHFKWPASRVSHLENGRARITDQILTALARLYRCTPADLIARAPQERRRGDDGGKHALFECTAALRRAMLATRTLRTALEGVTSQEIVRQFDAQLDDLIEAMACLSTLREPLALAETLVLSLHGELDLPDDPGNGSKADGEGAPTDPDGTSGGGLPPVKNRADSGLSAICEN